MAYGVDYPQGFVPETCLIPANPNMQFFEGLTIQSNYGNNIGMGDLVYVDAGGSIANLYDSYGAAASFTQSGAETIAGVFMGVYYEPPVGALTNGMYGNSGWQNAWYANSITANQKPAVCRILTTQQQWIFSVQSGALQEAPPTQTDPYPVRPTNFLEFVFKQDPTPGVPAGRIALNADGTSTMRVNAINSEPFQNSGASSFNAVQFVNYAQDPISGYPQGGIPYGNFLVRLFSQSYL